MTDISASLPALSQLIEQRLILMRHLAKSLESSSLALARNDAEAIARGAAHQAELCSHWSRLEEELRREAGRRSAAAAPGPSGSLSNLAHSARLQAEWEMLGTRIRYLTRVHWSLLRHLERSLAVLRRVVESCAPTYSHEPGVLGTEVRRSYVRLQAGEKSCRV
ncbi:MAG: hypothetical protein WAM89_12975 [Terriglobales bacterium]